MGEVSIRYFQISTKDLVYLKFILEAYEGFATLSTEDVRNGTIRISAPDGYKGEVETLLQELHSEVEFTEVYPPDFRLETPEAEIFSKEKWHA